MNSFHLQLLNFLISQFYSVVMYRRSTGNVHQKMSGASSNWVWPKTHDQYNQCVSVHKMNGSSCFLPEGEVISDGYSQSPLSPEPFFKEQVNMLFPKGKHFQRGWRAVGLLLRLWVTYYTTAYRWPCYIYAIILTKKKGFLALTFSKSHSSLVL